MFVGFITIVVMPCGVGRALDEVAVNRNHGVGMVLVEFAPCGKVTGKLEAVDFEDEFAPIENGGLSSIVSGSEMEVNVKLPVVGRVRVAFASAEDVAKAVVVSSAPVERAKWIAIPFVVIVAFQCLDEPAPVTSGREFVLLRLGLALSTVAVAATVD